MTTPLWCLVVVALLPNLLALVGDYFRHRDLGSFDNANPRRQAAALEGAGERAYAAQANAWEALGLFTVVVVVSHLAGAEAEGAANASLVFVATRLLHAGFYIANLSTLRSLSFVASLICCVRLLQLAAHA